MSRRSLPARAPHAIWFELGLESAGRAERADTWRQNLQNDLDEAAQNGLSRSLLYVLDDVREVLDETAYKLLSTSPRFSRNEPMVMLEHLGLLDDAISELEQHILNASDSQIIDYAEAYYDDAPLPAD